MRHAISDGGVVEGMTIDFRDRPDDDGRYGFAIEAVIGEIPSPIPGGTFVLMRVARQNQAGETLPPPLALAEVDPQAQTTDAAVFAPQPLTELYLIGYPSYDPRQALEVNRALLGSHPGVKRIQPGLLMFDRASGDDLQLYYDNSTFGGNGGSPIIDLRTGRVVGIHHSGAVGIIRFGTAFTRAVLNSPAARTAGLTVVAADRH
jgi:endonuclease G